MRASGLLSARMRRTSRLVALGAVLAGCASVRGPVPPGSPAIVAEPAAPSTPTPGCIPNPRVELWEHRLRSQPELRDAVEQSLARGAAYLPRLRAILARHDVPETFALLPALESGFDPRARGRYGELGLWQLRRPTARRFGLVVSAHRDDRLSPERATEAAARYLRHLRARYGEWPLALAAYNAGERRVDRALARHPDASFWELAENGSLPQTSREFVPHFYAMVRFADPASC
jgi:peptidoglycan lytic transglycosylase D